MKYINSKKRSIRVYERKILEVGLCLMAVLTLTSIVGSAAPTFISSKKVLEIDENTGGVGGPLDQTLFMTGGAFDAGVTNWTHVDLTSFSNVTNNDTAILFQVNTSDMTSAQKTALVNFVSGGGKLIIWDSDAGVQAGFPNNYNWLPTNLIFSTSVPGQLGATGGILQITEENDLSSSNPSNPKFINTSNIINFTDAVGDGNIVNTNGTDWCQDMFGQNAANPPQSGPAHMYSKPGSSVNSGFIVYSALDYDSGTVGGTGGNELRKMVQFELEVGSSSNLPCSVTVVPQNQTGSISGMKFNDLNGNGIHDSGEPGLSNWTIILAKQNGVTVTNLTDVNGDYNFTGLADGNYAVGEILKSGWNQTEPATGTYSVTITNGENITGKDFGNIVAVSSQKGSISGTKFNDLDDNGIRNSGEPGLPNWQITLTDQNNNVITKMTDTNGNYNFSNLSDGNYEVNEVLQSGWNQTFPVGGSYSVNITNGADISGLDFGNFQGQVKNICNVENNIKIYVKGKDNHIKVSVLGNDNTVKVSIKGKHNRVKLFIGPCNGDPINRADPANNIDHPPISIQTPINIDTGNFSTESSDSGSSTGSSISSNSISNSAISPTTNGTTNGTTNVTNGTTNGTTNGNVNNGTNNKPSPNITSVPENSSSVPAFRKMAQIRRSLNGGVT